MEDKVAAALADYCTECNGTGRDAFSQGMWWCGACGGTGKYADQVRRAEEMERIKKGLQEKKDKKE